MNKAMMIIFLGIVLCAFPFQGDGFAIDSTDPSDQMAPTGSSEDEDNTIESGDSKTDEDRAMEKMLIRVKREGTIAFDPKQYDTMSDKEIGQNQSVVISEFSDNRETGLDTHIGILYQLIMRYPVTKLYNTEPINSALQNVMGSLLSANGFSVNKKQDVIGGSITMKGTINKIWVELHHSIYAEVDIDVQIIDSENSKLLWSGKIAKIKEVETTRGAAWGAFYGVMGDGTELEPFLNLVLAEAIVEAWSNGGLKDIFRNFSEKRAKKKQTLKQLAHTEPATDDAKGNLTVGVSYYELGFFDKAVIYLKKAVNLRPKWARARYSLGLAFFKSNNKEAAIEQYEILKDLDENYAKKLFDIIHKAD